jgi:endonuclease YncB( thermonuclease family)
MRYIRKSIVELPFGKIRLEGPNVKVVGVTDGDSITVLHDGRQEQIRLWGIDCPEKRRDFRTKAKQLTSTLVFSNVVEIEPVTKDRYGRTVAFVKVADSLRKHR